MDEKVDKALAALYVDITCPVCQKTVALSNTVELVHGIHICFDCKMMPREARNEALLFRLLAQKEEKGGRFQGQVINAKKKSEMIANVRIIDTLLGNLNIHLENTVLASKLLRSIIQEVKSLKSKIEEV